MHGTTLDGKYFLVISYTTWRIGEKSNSRCLCTSIVVRHLLDCVAMLADVHDGDPRDLPQTTLQVSVARGHYVAFMLEEETEAGW